MTQFFTNVRNFYKRAIFNFLFRFFLCSSIEKTGQLIKSRERQFQRFFFRLFLVRKNHEMKQKKKKLKTSHFALPFLFSYISQKTLAWGSTDNDDHHHWSKQSGIFYEKIDFPSKFCEKESNSTHHRIFRLAQPIWLYIHYFHVQTYFPPVLWIFLRS